MDKFHIAMFVGELLETCEVHEMSGIEFKSLEIVSKNVVKATLEVNKGEYSMPLYMYTDLGRRFYSLTEPEPIPSVENKYGLLGWIFIDVYMKEFNRLRNNMV